MFPIRDRHPSNKFPLITILLIVVNVVVFFLELNAVDIEEFVYQYALVPKYIHFLQFNTLWPFLTSMFLHGGWVHILSNMWFLWIFGDNIEAAVGHFRFIFYYLFWGLCAALLQYFIDPTSTVPTLGASGAIAGVLGSYLVLFPGARIETFVTFGFSWQTIEVPAQIMLAYWFITQLFSGFGSVALADPNAGGVAFFAHIGGFIAGYLTTKLLVKPNLSWQRME